MSEDATAKPLSRWLIIGGFAILLAVGGVIFLTCNSYQGSYEAAQALFSAIRERRLQDAREMTMEKLGPFVEEQLPPSLKEEDQAHALERVRASSRSELSLHTSGYMGDSLAPYACLDAELDGREHLWIVLVKSSGVWRVL